MKSSRIFLILLISVVILGIAVVISWRGYEKYREKEKISEDVLKLQEEAQKIEEETQKLNDRIAYLRTPEYVEREAKDKLNLKKPGESVAVVQPDRFQQESTQVEDPQPKREVRIVINSSISNPKKWWSFFFGPK